jgi:hypothetical protein
MTARTKPRLKADGVILLMSISVLEVFDISAAAFWG